MRLKKVSFRGRITGGKLDLDNRLLMQETLSGYDNCIVDINITPAKSYRSSNQNAYYWGVVLNTLSNRSGHTPQDLHDAIRKLMTRPREVKIWNQVVEIPEGSSDMSVSEFSKYIDAVIKKSKIMGIDIPEPPPEILPEFE